MLHTVAETHAFRAMAKAQGMTDVEREVAIQMIAADPLAGDLIVGSGGLRKVRVPRSGGGKSGGYRVLTYFIGTDAPVYLLACLSKSTAGNFSDAQLKALAAEAKAIQAEVKQRRQP